MAKNMARIIGGKVVNIEWRSDNAHESNDLIDLNDRPVSIGDTYSDGKFYRDGAEVLTPFEAMQKDYANLEAAYNYLLTGGTT